MKWYSVVTICFFVSCPLSLKANKSGAAHYEIVIGYCSQVFPSILYLDFIRLVKPEGLLTDRVKYPISRVNRDAITGAIVDSRIGKAGFGVGSRRAW